MKSKVVWMVVFVAALAALPAWAGEKPQRVEEAYPGLTPGALAYALIRELPEGTLLKSQAVRVTAKELQAELDGAPEFLREQLRKNAPFILEQMTAGRLLLEAAKKSAAGKKSDVSGKPDAEIVQAYLDPALDKVKVSAKEVKEFYDKNVAMCGGTPFDKMKTELEQYLLQQKKEEAAAAYVKTLGQRMDITVSATWLKEQASLSRDNPVDQARSAGKPALVAFGGAGCCGPDPMAATLAAVGEQFKDQMSLISVEAKKEPVLTARYGISSIPAQILFDKGGKEVFRHNGVMSEEEITEQLKAVGVK